MKKSLLATVAAVALIAGPAIAQKQEAPAGDAKGAAPPPAAIQKAPAEKMAPSTTGQASPSGKASGEIKADTKSGDGKARMNADTKSGVDSKAATSADTKSGVKASGAADSKASSTAAQGQAKSGGSVALTGEQKAKVRASVLTANAPRVSDVNFSISVGTVVPRSVRLVAVPTTLIAIHPAWRGFMYFVHDDRIIIVEPGTLRIVTVLVV